MPIWRCGFRPFFLLALVLATVYMPLWVLILTGYVPTPTIGAVTWHGHEMIFGFAFAVIAGFLLTAVRNWTGQETAVGLPLAGLAGLWLAARVTLFLPGAPVMLPAVLDVVFAIALAITIARALLAAKNQRNYFVVGIVLLLALLNALWYRAAMGSGAWTAMGLQQLAMDLIILLIMIIGGRVIPFFTSRALGEPAPEKRVWLEGSAIAGFAIFALANSARPLSGAIGVLGLVVAVLHGWRLAGWWRRGVTGLPILWVLYSAYAWIVLGLAMRGAGALGWMPPRLWVHAFTVGGLALMCYGMMSRVALGHSGRPLRAARPIVAGYLLLNLSSLVRCLVPLVPAKIYTPTLHGSAGLWIFAFVAALVVYAPILCRPRADGKPG
jgi:uncharacterized protein involved in response to NO